MLNGNETPAVWRGGEVCRIKIFGFARNYYNPISPKFSRLGPAHYISTLQVLSAL